MFYNSMRSIIALSVVSLFYTQFHDAFPARSPMKSTARRRPKTPASVHFCHSRDSPPKAWSMSASPGNGDDVAVSTESDKSTPRPWETISQIGSLETPWVRMVGEKIRDNDGKLLDYWRVEKPASVVVVTIHRNKFVLPKQQYRPGTHKTTRDFPGGRLQKQFVDSPMDAVPGIVKRELGVSSGDIVSIESLNNSWDGKEGGQEGWPINSSFSNQVLFGAVARIRDDVRLDRNILDEVSYNYTAAIDIDPNEDDTSKDGQNDTQTAIDLLNELDCLQCRAVLMDWIIKKHIAK
mmetsp:Transcript_61491/g.150512  ORF Transcript_61491/g.150512 Transcript_61491/m.150512 type:complete len:293 (+) Transcript_61491:191-1069(+)